MLERHKMLALALERKITQREAARELGLSLSHTKRLARRLKEAEGNLNCLFYQRTQPAPNRLSEDIRDKVTALKRENRRSRSFTYREETLAREVIAKIHRALLELHTSNRMALCHFWVAFKVSGSRFAEFQGVKGFAFFRGRTGLSAKPLISYLGPGTDRNHHKAVTAAVFDSVYSS